MSGTSSGCLLGQNGVGVPSQGKMKKAKTDVKFPPEPIRDLPAQAPPGMVGVGSTSSPNVVAVAPLPWCLGQEATWFHIPRDVRRMVLAFIDNGSLLRLRRECRSMYHDATVVLQARAQEAFRSEDVKLVVLHEHLQVKHGGEWAAARGIQWLHLRKQDLEVVDSKAAGKRSLYAIKGLVHAVLRRFGSISDMVQYASKLKTGRAAKEERKQQQSARRVRLVQELNLAGLNSVNDLPDAIADKMNRYLELGTGWNEARCVKVIARVRGLREAVSERAWDRFFKAESVLFLLSKKGDLAATVAEFARLDEMHEARLARVKAIFRGCDRTLFDRSEFMHLVDDDIISVGEARRTVASVLLGRSERRLAVQDVAAKLGMNVVEVERSYKVRLFIQMDPNTTLAIALEEILSLALRQNDVSSSFLQRFVGLLDDVSTLEASFADVLTVVKAEQARRRKEMWGIAKRLGIVSHLHCPEVQHYVGGESNYSSALSGMLRSALVGLGVPGDYMDEVWDCDADAPAQIARYTIVSSMFTALRKFEVSRSGYKSWEAPLYRFAGMRDACISVLIGHTDLETFTSRWILLDLGMESEESEVD